MSVLPSNPARESTFFSVYSLVSVEVRPVSKNYSCSWSARAPDCPSLLVHLCLFTDQYSPAHFYMGFFFFWGGGGCGERRSATFHSILNSLYRTLAAHETLTNRWVWMGEWVWTHQNLLLHFFLLAYISPAPPPPVRPKHHPRKSSWGFVPSWIFDWCIKQIITQPPWPLQIFWIKTRSQALPLWLY